MDYFIIFDFFNKNSGIILVILCSLSLGVIGLYKNKRLEPTGESLSFLFPSWILEQ